MDRKAINKRRQNRGSDGVFAEKFISKLVKKVPCGSLPHMFLDSHYDENDRHENKSFKDNLEKLKQHLRKCGDRLETAGIIQNIKQEELKKMVLAAEKDFDNLHIV